MGTRRKSASEQTSAGLDGAAGSPDSPDILELSPFAGDLEAELAARPRRTVRPSLTVYLGAAVLLVAGFVAGIQADKHWGSGSSSSTSASAIPSGLRASLGSGRRQGAGGGGFGGFGGGGGGTASGGATFGTVKLVDGTTVYVDTGTGGIVAVKTDGSTKINITKQGTIKDLPPGTTVIVQGTPGGDGSVTATTITQGGVGARRGGG